MKFKCLKPNRAHTGILINGHVLKLDAAACVETVTDEDALVFQTALASEFAPMVEVDALPIAVFKSEGNPDSVIPVVKVAPAEAAETSPVEDQGSAMPAPEKPVRKPPKGK